MEERWLIIHFCSFFSGISDQGQNFGIHLR